MSAKRKSYVAWKKQPSRKIQRRKRNKTDRLSFTAWQKEQGFRSAPVYTPQRKQKDLQKPEKRKDGTHIYTGIRALYKGETYPDITFLENDAGSGKQRKRAPLRKDYYLTLKERSVLSYVPEKRKVGVPLSKHPFQPRMKRALKKLN